MFMECFVVVTDNEYDLVEDRIDQISRRHGLDWEKIGWDPDIGDTLYSLPPEFPIGEIEYEDWFRGYDLKEV